VTQSDARPTVTFPAKEHCHYPLAGSYFPSRWGTWPQCVSGCLHIKPSVGNWMAQKTNRWALILFKVLALYKSFTYLLTYVSKDADAITLAVSSPNADIFSKFFHLFLLCSKFCNDLLSSILISSYLRRVSTLLCEVFGGSVTDSGQ